MTPAAEQTARAFAARAHGVLIDGAVAPPDGAERITVLDPATEERLAEVPAASPAVVNRAVAAARAAWSDGRWSGRDPVEQEAVLRRLAGLVGEHADELAWLETLDNGKTLAEARGDVAGTQRVFSYCAGWPTKLTGDVHNTDRRFLALSVGEPVGVCGQITTAPGFSTADVRRAVWLGRSIRAGTVWINAYGSIRPEVPFGGFGQSGVGRELGAHALDAYRETKSIFFAA